MIVVVLLSLNIICQTLISVRCWTLFYIDSKGHAELYLLFRLELAQHVQWINKPQWLGVTEVFSFIRFYFRYFSYHGKLRMHFLGALLYSDHIISSERCAMICCNISPSASLTVSDTDSVCIDRHVHRVQREFLPLNTYVDVHFLTCYSIMADFHSII